MGREPLSSEDRGRIIGAYQCSTKPATIARTLTFPPSTVYGTINRYKKNGSPQAKVRSGRPLSLSDRDQRVVRRVVLAERHQPLGEITNQLNSSLGTDLHPRRYLTKAGFSSCAACKKPLGGDKRTTSTACHGQPRARI
jgi:transposase